MSNLKSSRGDYEIIQNLIASEAEAISEYANAIKGLSDENAVLKNILADILEEERMHLEQLEDVGKSLIKGGEYKSRDRNVKKENDELMK